MADNHIYEDSASSRVARASRLKKLRKMTQLSRKSFCKKHNISAGTLQNWETARFGGLTEKGAKIMIKALTEEKIICSFEWLMFQVGQTPKIAQKPTQKIKKNHENEMDTVLKELNYFYSLHHSPFHTIVNDDSMEPIYKKGQTICGEKYSSTVWYKVTNQICIVQLTNKEILLRLTRTVKDDPTKLELIALNPLSDCNYKHYITDKIDFIAPVLWSRCKWEPKEHA